MSADGFHSQQGSNTSSFTPTSSSIDSYIDPNPRVQSLSFGVAGLNLRRTASDSHAAEAFYGEGSAANRRPAVTIEDEESQQSARPQQRPKNNATNVSTFAIPESQPTAAAFRSSILSCPSITTSTPAGTATFRATTTAAIPISTST